MIRMLLLVVICASGCAVTTRFGVEDTVESKSHYQPSVKMKAEVEFKGK